MCLLAEVFSQAIYQRHAIKLKTLLMRTNLKSDANSVAQIPHTLQATVQVKNEFSLRCILAGDLNPFEKC